MSVGNFSFPTPRGDCEAYLAVPEGADGHGVLVLSEWWGLVDQIADVCDRLAREGFVALAPDLYRGERTDDPERANRLMMDLEIPRAGEELSAAATALLNHHAVRGSRVAAAGFCMGGQLALYAGSLDPRVRAVVDFYGIHPEVSVDASALRENGTAVLGIFAERDEFVPPKSARELEARLREAGVRHAVEIYPEASHAFMNDARPDVYDAAAAARGWSRMLSFLRAELDTIA
ncbi:MAG: dienelactone hydrolase family protein [Myxococcales bacterium]|nr:dienelactone hydrolase family protein [Myxococcales bacterium]